MSLCCWRRRNHALLTAIVDKYFAHPSFSAHHFLLAMPSTPTPTRDSSDSPGAREHEYFFAILPLLASQSITESPASHRFQAPPIPLSLADQSVTSRPVTRLRREHHRHRFVLFVWGLFCLVEREEHPPLRITMESNHSRIHSSPSNNKPKQDRHR